MLPGRLICEVIESRHIDWEDISVTRDGARTDYFGVGITYTNVETHVGIKGSIHYRRERRARNMPLDMRTRDKIVLLGRRRIESITSACALMNARIDEATQKSPSVATAAAYDTRTEGKGKVGAFVSSTRCRHRESAQSREYEPVHPVDHCPGQAGVELSTKNTCSQSRREPGAVD